MIFPFPNTKERLEKVCAALGEYYTPTDLSLLLYGSITTSRSRPDSDVDMAAVFKNRSVLTMPLKTVLNNHLGELDIKYYYRYEVEDPYFFMDIRTSIFSLEWLADGVLIFGDENPFALLLKRISTDAYRRSLKEKMFDYVLRVRRVYLNKKRNAHQLALLRKLTRKILIDLMLFKGTKSFHELNALRFPEILAIALAHDLVHPRRAHMDLKRFDEWFALVEDLSEIVFSLPDYRVKRVHEAKRQH